MSARTPFPKVFWVANLIEVLERFSYYGIYFGFGVYMTSLTLEEAQTLDSWAASRTLERRLWPRLSGEVRGAWALPAARPEATIQDSGRPGAPVPEGGRVTGPVPAGGRGKRAQRAASTLIVQTSTRSGSAPRSIIHCRRCSDATMCRSIRAVCSRPTRGRPPLRCVCSMWL